ncbi:MAG: outer membrane protein assembly factor BamA [Candidatus Adiutrix sp.]|jgi:outer membrane protein insertion porin family|nr:outer membrane protein assembly factor BamA [Candidatus Adiutrix sp.]
MNRYLRPLHPVLLLILALGPVGAASPLAAQNDGHKVAVMPLRLSVEGAQLEQVSRMGKGLSDVLGAALAAQDLQPLPMGDGALALSDASAQAQARAMGADYLFQGRVTKVGERFNLTGQLLALTPDGRSSRRQTLPADNTGQFPQTLERLVLLTTDHLSGGGAPVVSVDITGNTMMSSQAILNTLRLQPGGNYNEAKAASDIKRIYALGYFDDVQVQVDDAAGGRAVHFIVRERPQIKSIVFRGNKKFKDDDLLEAVGLKPHDVPSERAVADSVESLKSFYAKKGYSDVQVSSHLEAEGGGGGTLVYDITEGGKVYIRRIEFDGNEFYSNWTLSRQIDTSTYNCLISWLSGAGKLNLEKLSGDAQRLESYYQNHGFIQAQVGDPLVAHDAKGKLVVTFPIVEGPRFKVGRVSLGGRLLEDDDPKTILKATNLKGETWFSRELLQEDVKAIQTYYADLGYAHNQVEPRLDGPRDGEFMDVVFEVDPRQKVYYDRITIVGNDRTRDKVIRRQLAVAEGDLSSSSKMIKSQSNLMRSTFFEQVNLVPGPSDSDDKMNLRVEVRERPTGSLQVGGGYSSYNSLFGVIRLAQDNLFGYGRRASIEANVGHKSSYYDFSFTDPWVFDIPLSAGFDLFNYQNKYTNYTKNSNGTAVRLGYPLWHDFYISGRFSYEKVHINHLKTENHYIRNMAQYDTDVQALFSLRRDTRNHFFFPTKGSVARLSYGQALTALGGDTDFSKYEAEGAFWLPAPVYKGASFMAHGQAGYLKDHRTDGHPPGLPTYERYMIGGINSVRGYDWYDISPNDSDGVAIGGVKMMTINFEFAFPLLPDAGLYGVTFTDLGNAWKEGDKAYRTNDLYRTVGGGLRFLSPLGPIRLEYGKPVGRKVPGVGHSGQWEFTMGSMF